MDNIDIAQFKVDKYTGYFLFALSFFIFIYGIHLLVNMNEEHILFVSLMLISMILMSILKGRNLVKDAGGPAGSFMDKQHWKFRLLILSFLILLILGFFISIVPIDSFLILFFMTLSVL